MSVRTIVIADLASGSGRCGKIWPDCVRALEAHFPGHDAWLAGADNPVASLAVQAAQCGAEMIITVGDTGTANQTADALLAEGLAGAKGPVLGFVPAGAGSDLAASLHLTGPTEEIVRKLRDGQDKMLDAGRLSYTAADGTWTARHVFNIANIGVSAVIARRAEHSVLNRFLGTHGVFFAETLLALIYFKFPKLRISADGQEPYTGPVAELVIANGRIYGGGMAIAPDADMEDGLFDIVAMKSTSKLYLLDQVTRIYNGGHRNLPDVMMFKTTGLTIESAAGAAPAELVIDGILCGRLPVRADILKGALKVRCGAPPQ